MKIYKITTRGIQIHLHDLKLNKYLNYAYICNHVHASIEAKI